MSQQPPMRRHKTRKINIEDTAQIVRETLQETSEELANAGNIILQVSRFTLQILAMLAHEQKVSFQEDAPQKGSRGNVKTQTLILQAMKKMRGTEG